DRGMGGGGAGGGLTLAASSRPPLPTRAMNSRRLLSSIGDFLPYALSAPPTGPCARFSTTSACRRGGPQVLGANLNCSESGLGIRRPEDRCMAGFWSLQCPPWVKSEKARNEH